jgi:hypothetical protein
MNTLGTPTSPASADATASGQAKAPAGAERRRSARHPVITPGVLRAVRNENHVDPLDPGQQVMVTDVSLHGIGFRSDQALSTETRYVIEIGMGPLHLTSRLRIVRVRRRPDGVFEMGAEFC